MRNKKIDGIVVPYKAAESRKETSIPAAARLRRGKTLISVGTAIAMLGIAVYCMIMFIGDVTSEPVRFPAEGLIIIGTGLAVWIVGAIRYLNAAIDIGPTDEAL